MASKAVTTRLQEYFNENRYDDAIRFLEDLLREAPQENRDGSIDCHLGRIAYFRKDYARARSHFLAALTAHPTNFPAKFFLARTREALGENSDTLRLYGDSIVDRPDWAQIADFTNDYILRTPFKTDELQFLNTPRPKRGTGTEPLISILILCYNKMEYTERCLASLFRNTDYPNFEVIVLDNASVDDTPLLLETWSRRVTFVRSATNLGFVGGNNEAAKHVRGEYLVFLNNDTELTKGWLTELHRCFETHPGTGAAGSMLVYPDGKLQEAGGIIFRDGTGWNYGRGNAVKIPLFQFSREVDYCSGAALMVRRDLFEKLGGFDERFAPAYYEDTDLCFGVRKLGYKVLYCPLSVVVHHEGATAGTDLSSGFKKYQNINAPKFRAKWAKELALQHPKDPDLRYQFSNRSRGRQVLIIDDLPPLPDRAAGSLRLYHTLSQFLNLGCQVTYAHLIGKDLDAAAKGYLKEFRMRGVEMVWCEYESWWAIRDTKEVKPILRNLIASMDLPLRKYDLVYICFHHIARYFTDLIREADPDVPILVDSMDLHYLRELRRAEVKNDPALRKQAQETKKAELEVYAGVDAVTTVTEEDRDTLRKDLAATPVFIMTDVHDPVDSVPSFAGRSGLVFVGNFNHTPNEDAVLFFVRDVFPLIRKELPDVKLYIVGNNPTPAVKALATESVIVTGWVPSVKPYLEKCRVEVVPLRYGAGNKGKVGEAFAHGIPMVMTAIGAEGMRIRHGEHAFIADNPAEFARHAIKLYNDPKTWERFSLQGRKHVASMYSSALKRRRIEYLLSFKGRKAFKSYRALQYPLPPEISIVLPLAQGGLDDQMLAAVRDRVRTSHELLAAGHNLSDKEREQAAGAYPAVRMPARFHASFLESCNDAMAASLGSVLLLHGDASSQDTSWIEALAAQQKEPAADVSAAAADKRLAWIMVSRRVIEKIGGLDERFASWQGAAADFLLRSRLAGFTVSCSSVSSGASASLTTDQNDNTLFHENWGITPFAALDGAAPHKTRELLYPIHRDLFIRHYERAHIDKKEEAFSPALAALCKAVNSFHAAERTGCSAEFFDLLAEVDEVLKRLSAQDNLPGLIAGMMQRSPADKAIALGAAEYLLERRRFEEAARVIGAWLPLTEEHGKASKAVVEKTRALSAGLAAGQEKGDRVSIVILTWNELKYTKECVESIRRNTPEPHEIIFVDNGSTDGTVPWLRALMAENPHYHLIENGTNLGFAKGCNQGIEAASGAYVLLLNNDVVVTPGWLGGMLECFGAGRDTGIVGPMTNNISGLQKVPVAGYDRPNQLDGYAAAFREKNRGRRIFVRRVVGFCMLFKKSLVDEIGGLDERFGSGNFEDDDLCLRSALAGCRNVICGDVFIHHHGSRSFVGNKVDYRSAMLTNEKYFTQKWSDIDPRSPHSAKLVVLNAVEQARAVAERGDVDNAVQAILAGIGRAPEAAVLYTTLAELFLDARRYQDALETLQQMPEAEPDPKRLALIGYCKDGLGLLDEAAEYADQALALHERSALALNLKGMVAYQQGERGEAEQLFLRSRGADPGYAEPWTNLGVLRWAEGKRDEALTLFEKGFILAPAANDIAASYQSAFTELQKFMQAEPVVREALALHPRNKRLKYLLIDLLMNSGQNAAALAEIEQAMLAYGHEELLPFALQLREQVGPLKIPPKGKRPSLSLCMIVKNEERFLARCLAAAKNIADEIIVVDTGSLDKTKDLALAFGAQVYDFPWTEDFSAARNVSLARAAGDWILVLDADELIAPQDADRLRELVARSGSRKTAWTFYTRNYVTVVNTSGWTANDGAYRDEEAGTGWFPSIKVRLFPNDKSVRFANPVHEMVEPSLKKPGISVKESPVPVHHYGKLNEKKDRKKGEAYYELGKKKIEELGNDIMAITELAIQARILERYSEAVELWQRALRIKSNFPIAWFNMGSALLELKRYDEALTASKKARELNPDQKEIVYNYAICELYAGDVEKSVAALENLLATIPDYPVAKVMLAAAYSCSGRADKAMELFTLLRDLNFGFAEYLAVFAENLIAAGRHGYARALLEAARESGNVNTKILDLLSACSNTAVAECGANTKL